MLIQRAKFRDNWEHPASPQPVPEFNPLTATETNAQIVGGGESLARNALC